MLSLLKRKARVLVLDDDPAMQRLLIKLLGREGLRVDVVSAGAQAIEKLGSAEYDLLLLDLMTPTEGGITVIKHLKKAKPQLLRRVVLVTASPESVLKSVARDAAAVVHKPFEPEQLVTVVKRVLAQQ
ncbi:MAG TPA: response regulator [Thermoanaerobaculia bacterium]|nr:response regulator [Thermoanaerobaculia bacterium]